MLPYGVAARLVWGLWGLAPVQAVALRRARRKYPLHPLHRGERAPDAPTVRRHLHHLYLRHWREERLDRCSDAEFARWTRFRGAEHYEAARAEGRGVILAGSHYAAARTLKIALARFGIDLVTAGVTTRPQGPWRHGKVHWITAKHDEAERLRALVELRKVLRRGGNVHIAADSRIGHGAVEVEFLGRRKRFGQGVAVLASSTRAPVVPVFAVLCAGGRLEVEFLAPLARPDPALDREARLAAMVREYAARLEQRCREDPALIMPGGALSLRPHSRRGRPGGEPRARPAGQAPISTIDTLRPKRY